MTTKLFTSALFAGLAAGLIAALLQFSLVEPLILEGEEYESGARIHFAGAGNDHHAEENDHHAADDPLAADTVHHANDEQDQGNNDASSPADQQNIALRFVLVFFTDLIVFVGWGLLLVTGFAVAERYGHRMSLKNGLLWGGAGFIAVHMAPGIGLPPELPGIPAADLQMRQVWWLATVLATAAALALFAFGRGYGFILLGLALLVAPHLVGAPQVATFTGLAPPELAGELVARSLAISLTSWAVLGLVASFFWSRNPESDG